MKNKKFAIILLISVFLFACVVSIIRIFIVPAARTGPFGIGLPSNFAAFVGKNMKFSINYPESWVIFETLGGNHGDKEIFATINVPGRSWPNGKIALMSSKTDDMNQVVNHGIEKTRDLPGLSEISINQFQSAHFEGLVREYSWISESLFSNASVKCVDYFFINNNNGYIVTFCAEEKQWPIVQDVIWQMMDSFTLS